MKQVSGTLKLLYSQYRELAGFAQFGSDLDADTKSRLEMGKRIVEVLKQDRSSPIEVELQIAIIFAAANNMLKEIPVEDIGSFESELFELLTLKYEALLCAIKESGALTDDTRAALRSAIDEAKAKFLGKENNE